MDNDKYKIYDMFVNRVFVNLYSLGKENNNTIEIDNFNKNDNRYKLIYEICNLMKIYYDYSIFINMPWYQRYFSKYRHTKGKRNMKNPLDIDEFINFSSEGLEFSLDELYNEYYTQKKGNN